MPFVRTTLRSDNVPNDMLGQAYEYLIRKFADDSGHTAAEFYTNRTVVRLMSLIVDRMKARVFTILHEEAAACFLIVP